MNPTPEDIENAYPDNLRGCIEVSFPPGWAKIVKTTMDDLVRLDPEVHVGQIKEKFGALRIYLDSAIAMSEVHRIANEAEILSSATCMDCGEYGLRGVLDGLVFTRCLPCQAKFSQK